MLSRKLTIGIVTALYGAASGYASAEPQTFIYKPFGVNPVSQAVMPAWEVVNRQYTPWINQGDFYNCSAWSPPVNLVNLDEGFTQTRTCSQTQARTRVDELYSATLDQTRFEGPFGESRVISVEESQGATGTRDFITGVREDSWPSWDRVGGFYGCDGWSPEPSTIDYGTSFTQSRDCSWDEGRYRDVFNTWQSNIETYLRTDSDARTVPYTDTQPSVGTYRDWQPTTSTFTTWVDIGEDYGHSSWTPAPVAQASNFTQSRDYNRDQQRFEQFREQDRITSDIRNDGAPVLRAQTLERVDSRTVSTGFTPWAEVKRSEYTLWTPAPTSQTSNYNQSRSYTSTEERERFYTAPSDGELNRATESRDIGGQSESRPLAVSYSDWSELGGNYDCAAWGPLPETVGVDEDYTQSRQCKQNEIRDRTYTAGGTELNRVEENNTLTVTQTRAQKGVGTWVEHTSTFTSWVNEGGGYFFGEWTPEASSQVSEFTQSRDFKQNETRDEQKRERDVHSGAIRNIGSPVSHLHTVLGSESRTIDVTASSWLNGEKSNHTTWTPDISTQKSSFTQSRTYSQAQSHSWTYSASEATIYTRQESRVLSNQNETRDVVVSPEAWVDDGGMYSCSSWDKKVSDYYIEVSVTRTRSCSMDQVRKLTYSIDGEVILEAEDEKTISRIESETATGTKHHTISLSSCGYDDVGCAGKYISVDGQVFSTNRGWQLIVLHPVTKAIVSRAIYDAYISETNATSLEGALRNAPNGYLMLLNTWDEPSKNSAHFTDELRSYLGASLTEQIGHRSSYYIAGYKNGSKLSESYSPRSTSGVTSGTIVLN